MSYGLHIDTYRDVKDLVMYVFVSSVLSKSSLHELTLNTIFFLTFMFLCLNLMEATLKRLKNNR